MLKLLLIAWFAPAVAAVMILAGAARARHTRRHKLFAYPTLMIVQITTIGNEETVNEIIRTIRSYKLDFPHRIWVVTEPWSKARVEGPDELIVVPEEFRCQASYKGRALEYSRRLRAERGLDRGDVKVLFVDDDSLPTKGYMQKVFKAQFDVCEGITTPRNGYGRLLSHMDDLRTMNCLFVCSMFQGFGHPIHVHGEGLCVRGSAEAVVTWDYPVFASEDLVFGHMAVVMGLSWGFVWDYIQITSPFTWRDFLKQRQRWLWGNIHAIRRVLPVRSTVLLIALYIQGFFTFVMSTVGIGLAFTGRLNASSPIFPWLFASMGIWLAMFALCGAISSGGGSSRGLRRARDIVVSPLLAWATSAVAFGVLLVALYQGNPGRFEVIEKTDPKAPKRIPERVGAEEKVVVVPEVKSLEDIWR